MAINRDKVLKEAEALVRRGKLDQAIREYEKILQANPNDANTINRVGDLYGRIGQVDRAVELYEGIAEHFTRDGFIQKAIAILRKVNRIAPQRLDIFERLAELYIQQGLMVEAKSQYQILAEWHAKNNQLEKAAAANQRLIQLDPSNHVAHLRLADILMQLGQAEEALAVYDRLGRVLLDRGRLDEAERLYRHALEQDPPTGAFLAPLCEALLDSGRAPVAREFLAAGVSRSPDDEGLQLLQIRVQLTFGEARQALESARRLLERSPDDHDIRSLVGQALLKAGEAVEARDTLLPTARSLTARGNHVAAQQMIQGLLKAMPHDQEVLRVAVAAFAPSGETETIFTLRAALADSLFRSGQQAEAGRLYQELLREDPDNELFRRRSAEADVRADVKLRQEDEEPLPVPEPTPPAPRPTAGAAPPASPFDPSERLAEAAVFAKYGLLDKAAAHLRGILEVAPAHREARERLAMLLLEQGDSEGAAEAARPLIAVYRATGDVGAEQTLRGMIPGLESFEQRPATAVEQVPVPADAEDVVDEVILIEFDEAEDELVAPSLAPAAVAEAAEDRIDLGELRFGPPEIRPGDELTGASTGGQTGGRATPSWGPSFEVSLDRPPASEGTVDDWERELREAARAMPERPDAGLALSELDDLERSVRGGEAKAALSLGPTPPEAVVHDVREARHLPSPEQPVDEDTEAQPVVFDFEGLPVTAPDRGALATRVGSEFVGEEELVDLSDSLAGPNLEALDRLDFFIQQELLEDALRELQLLERDHADDPDIAQRRLTLKAKGVLIDSVVDEAVEASEELFADEEDFFDLAKELEDELAEEEALVDEATGRGKDEALLEEVFREFQKGVAEQLSEEDSDTHFNLGIAYKEMGLLPEAIREFQISARDPAYFVESCSMIGVCYLEQGMAESAADWYQKALAAADLPPASRVALRYDLAASLELAGEIGQACDLYRELYGADPGFRDVADRLAYLEQQRQAN